VLLLAPETSLFMTATQLLVGGDLPCGELLLQKR
jgi:hypothetical protein